MYLPFIGFPTLNQILENEKKSISKRFVSRIELSVSSIFAGCEISFFLFLFENWKSNEQKVQQGSCVSVGVTVCFYIQGSKVRIQGLL